MSGSSVFRGRIAGMDVRGSDARSAGDVLAWDDDQGTLRLRAGMGVNVLDYGAVGDGATDSGAAINLALTAAASSGVRAVFIPAGIYIIEVALSIPDGVTVYGAGWDSGAGTEGTILRMKGGNTNLTGVFYRNAKAERITIRDLTIDGNKANNTSGDGIRMHLKWSRIWRVKFQKVEDNAIYLAPTSISTDSALLNFVESCEIVDANKGIVWDFPLGDSWIRYNNIGADVANMEIAGGPNRIIGNHCNGSPTYNIYAPSAFSNTMIWHNLLEGAGENAIYIKEIEYGAGHNTDPNITGNLIKNASKDADDTSACIHLEGFDATHPVTNAVIANNTFITDDAGTDPKYAVYAKHVSGLTVQGNTSQAMGTAYWFVEGTSLNVKIQGNVPEDYTLRSIAVGDTPYTVVLADGVVLADASGGAITVTLMGASTAKDRTIRAIKTDAGGNAVTFNGTSLAAQGDTAAFWSDGNSWWSI